jgi:hypothetical protein
MTTQAREPEMGLPFEKVWAMFQESDRRMQKLSEETDRKIQKIARQVQEIDRRVQKIEEGTSRRFQELAPQIQGTAQQAKEPDPQIKESDEQKTNWETLLLNSKWMRAPEPSFGELYDYEVIPHIVEKFCNLGFQIDSVSGSCEITLNKATQLYACFESILEGREAYIGIVVSTIISDEDVDEYDPVKGLVRSLEVFRLYRNKIGVGVKQKIYGALAGAVMSDKAKTAALKAGLYVVVPSGDTVKIDVPEGFTPKAW